MPDLDALVDELGERCAEMLAELKAELAAKIAAVTVRSVLIDRDGDLVLTFGDGVQCKAGPVVGRDGTDGKDGEPGAPGAPGLGFEDLDVNVLEDGRTLAISFDRGELVETFQLELPVLIYRGIYEPNRDYRPGDSVTFGGSAWVCQAATSTRPGEGDDWRLAVKRGRDGKDLRGPV